MATEGFEAPLPLVFFLLASGACTSAGGGGPPDPPGTVNPPSRYEHDSAAMSPASVDEPDASFDSAPPPPPGGMCIAQCTMDGDGGTPAQCIARGGHCGDSPVHGGDDGGDGFLQCCLK